MTEWPESVGHARAPLDPVRSPALPISERKPWHLGAVGCPWAWVSVSDSADIAISCVCERCGLSCHIFQPSPG